MYDTSSITALAETIGFGESTKNITDTNKVGSSGMEFNSFHKLVTMPALLVSLPTKTVGSLADLTAKLTQIRMDAARKTLADVLDSHVSYVDETVYDTLIVAKLNLLRGAFGYAVAITCIELMMASGRYNYEQRSIRETYATLKLELEGAKNDFGKTISYGIASKYLFARDECQRVIFQSKPKVNAKSDW